LLKELYGAKNVSKDKSLFFGELNHGLEYKGRREHVEKLSDPDTQN
jgi:hypothetical protein